MIGIFFIEYNRRNDEKIKPAAAAWNSPIEEGTHPIDKYFSKIFGVLFAGAEEAADDPEVAANIQDVAQVPDCPQDHGLVQKNRKETVQEGNACRADH